MSITTYDSEFVQCKSEENNLQSVSYFNYARRSTMTKKWLNSKYNNRNKEKWKQKLVILEEKLKYALKIMYIVALLQQNVKIVLLNIWLDKFN